MTGKPRAERAGLFLVLVCGPDALITVNFPVPPPLAPHTGVLGPLWAIPVIRHHHGDETGDWSHASPAPQTRSRYTYTCVVLARVGVMKAMSPLSFAFNIPTPTIPLPRIRRHRSRPMSDMSGPRYVASPSGVCDVPRA